MTAPSTPGRVVVVSGPSGSGKTTLVEKLLARSRLPLVRSVSATTRAARPGEVDGVNYHFLSREEFDRRRAAGEFLECAEVYGRGHWYGTLRQEVSPSLAAGKWVVLEIDVQGMLAVLREYPDAISIFLRPPGVEELERRLRERQTETEEAIQRRLDEARRELALAQRYRYQVVNDDLDRAVAELDRILSTCGGTNS
jgi:guanylate kinase